MATKQQIEDISKEADAVVAASSTDPHAFDYLPSELPGPTTADLKAAIVELAVIARSHAPLAQEARIVELLALAQ